MYSPENIIHTQLNLILIKLKILVLFQYTYALVIKFVWHASRHIQLEKFPHTAE